MVRKSQQYHLVLGLVTYVSPWLQVFRINCVFVEAWPFLECLSSTSLVFFVVPIQHLGLVFEVYALAELFHDAFGVIKKVICVNYTGLDSFVRVLDEMGAIGIAVDLFCDVIGVCAIRLMWSNLAYLSQIIEYSTNLVIPSLGWIEIIEAGKLVKWRDSAAEVRRDARMGIADQEGEVKFRE